MRILPLAPLLVLAACDFGRLDAGVKLDPADGDSCQAFEQHWDGDGDGAGDPHATVFDCYAVEGFVQNAYDCDDADAAVGPWADELCNGRDDDCDGVADDDAVDLTTWYLDTDGDGFGAEDGDVVACEAPAGFVAEGGDCDDADASVHPGANDPPCGGEDRDCDGDVQPTAAAAVGEVGFGDLADAVDAAADGGVVEVCPGTWPTALVLRGRTLTLVGAGPGISVLTGGGTDRIVAVDGGTLRLQGLTLRDGRAEDGGGALAATNARVALDDCAVEDNVGGTWGAVHVAATGQTRASLEVTRSVFEGNSAGASGGAIGAEGGGALSVRIDDATFRYNAAADGGGAVAFSGGELAVDGSIFSGNVAAKDGGALRVGGGVLDAVTLSGSQLLDNRALERGGGLATTGAGSGSLRIADTVVQGGQAELGGGLSLGGTGPGWTLLLDGVSLASNQASMGAAAVDVDARLASARIEVAEARIWENVGALGAVSVQGVTTLSSTCSDWGQGAHENAGGDVLAGRTSYGFGACATFACTSGGCR